MQVVSCDICRKKMDNPVTGRNFFYFADSGICEPCKEVLEGQIRNTIRSKEPFAVEWYNKLVSDSLEKAIQKGKI